MAAYDWITLTTDYGLSDGYTGVLHGVIATRAPWVRVIDVTHLVPPGDVSRGAAVLAQAVGHLPPAVHVGVVDPGVGTGRRAVAIETPQGMLVAARLAAGVPLADAGPAIDPGSLVRLPEPIVVAGDGYLEAEVLTVDRFGNVQLAAPGTALDGLGEHLEVGGVRATRAKTFADGQPGRLIVYVDSAGKVALAVNGGRAVVALAISPGDVLRMTRRD